MAAVGALVVLAVSAGAAAAFLLSRQHSGDDAGAPPATASPPPPTGGFAAPPGGYPPPWSGDGPPTPPPDGQGPPPGASGAPPLPPGFQRVTDPAGFSVILPPAFARDARPPDTYYWSPDHSVRFAERTSRPDPHGPYAALRARHLAGPRTYPGYRDAAVTRTQQHGQPAALWEFTSTDAGARRTFELCWTEHGRMYDIALSGPAANAGRARNTFAIARGTFQAE